MENNQHSSSKNSAAADSDRKTFTNDQPGQQLPTGNSSNDIDQALTTENEQHSESSKPENDNETLGTP
jgi:hypothetical protein